MKKRKHKNTVPSAPEDMLEPGSLFACDGRKREDVEFVGARTPDADASPTRPLRRPRRKPRRRP